MNHRTSCMWITFLLLPTLSNESAVGAIVNESFICVADKATGFYHDGDSGWISADFKIGDEKFVLRSLSDSEISNYKILNKLTDSDAPPTHGRFNLGDEHASMYCTAKTTTLFCNMHTSFGELRFDSSSLRYQETYFGNYWVGADENDNTPSITIGRCTKTG